MTYKAAELSPRNIIEGYGIFKGNGVKKYQDNEEYEMLLFHHFLP